MRKILFIIRDFKTGGIPRCMQTVLQFMNTSKYDVDLLCLHQEGPFKDVMTNCRVLKQNRALYHLLQFRNDYKNNPLTYIYKVGNKIFEKVGKKSLVDYTLKNLAKSLSGKYDCVIAFSGGISAELAQMIDTNNRIVWNHNDYSFEPARDDEKTDFSRFNSIVCVSKSAKKSFDKIYPQFASKSIAIYNLINDKYIRQSAKNADSVNFDNTLFNIVSVGRICWQKNFSIIPSILDKIPQNIRKNIRWYIIGNGSETATNEVKAEIAKYGLEKECIILGPQANPYAFIRKANLFILTSIHESFCLVVHEARALGTPVLSVPIPVIEELCGNDCIYKIEDLPDAIVNAYSNTPEQYKEIDYSDFNNSIIKELEALLDS